MSTSTAIQGPRSEFRPERPDPENNRFDRAFQQMIKDENARRLGKNAEVHPNKTFGSKYTARFTEAKSENSLDAFKVLLHTEPLYCTMDNRSVYQK